MAAYIHDAFYEIRVILSHPDKRRNPAKLYYDLLPFCSNVHVAVMVKRSWPEAWTLYGEADVSNRQYSRVIDSLQLSLTSLALQGYRYLGYR